MQKKSRKPKIPPEKILEPKISSPKKIFIANIYSPPPQKKKLEQQSNAFGWFNFVILITVFLFFLEYHEAEASPSTSDDESHSRSDSPTPCNSPKASRKSTAESSNLRGSYAQSTLTRNQISPGVSTLTRQNAAVRWVKISNFLVE